MILVWLLVFRVKDLGDHSLASLTRKICSKLADLGISSGRFPPPLADFLTGRFGYLCQQIPQADFLTGRFGFLWQQIPPCRFPDWQIWLICWQIYWLADMGISASTFPPGRFSDWQFGKSAADLLTGRFGYFCQQILPQQIFWLAYLGIYAGRLPQAVLVNLLADLLTGRFGESVGIFTDWQIWVFLWADSPPADILTGRFGYFCGQIPPGRFPGWQIWWICWQIYWLAYLGISAGRSPHPPKYHWPES